MKERKHQRQDCLVPIDAKQGSAFGSSQTIDISAGGMGLLVKKSVPVGKTIAVEIEFDPSQEPLVVKAEVKWVQKLFGSKLYRAGISFQDFLAPQGQNRLKKVLPL